tara:strand:- start:58 stop:318 length:261 start_codon:yes stop_codon:yes gene_type:complete
MNRNDKNEIWLAIEGLQDTLTEMDSTIQWLRWRSKGFEGWLNNLDYSIERLKAQIELLEKNSHPPVKWEAIIGELSEKVESLEREK